MFWLICLWLVCSPAFVLQVWIIWNTPLPVLLHTHTHTSSSVLVFARCWVENINWRQSVPRLRGLEWGLDSESWLSSQEVLLLTTLHKHWKRDPKKMSQTHYFHCKHTDIYCSHFSLFSHICLSRAEGFICLERANQKPDLCVWAASDL